MPTIYTWYPVSAPGGAAAPASAGVGTGVGPGRPYAFSREMNPATGDAAFDRSRRTWKYSAPLLQKVIRCLRTERGSARRDLAYGVEWYRLDNARANADVIAKQVVTAALKRFVDAGELVELRVEADAIPAAGGRALLLKVSFRDARGDLFTLQGRPSR